MPRELPSVDNKGQKTQSDIDGAMVQRYKDLAPSPDQKDLLQERLTKMKSDILVRDNVPKIKLYESDQMKLNLKTVGS